MTETTHTRTALVTGGASGIGLATVEILLAEGWRVAVLDRDPAALARVRTALAAWGTQARCEALDVTDAEAAAQVVAEIAATFGPVRGLVTSAGIGANSRFTDSTPDLFRRLHEVNVIGTVNVAQPAVKAMQAAGGGAIVTVSSISGLVGNVGRAAYGATKGAIVNLSRIMAVELAREGIRVNSVAPGPIETPLAAAVHTPAIRAQWHEKVLLRRYGNPAEVGQAIAFLLDERRASYITGQVLAVDGGFVAGGLLETEAGM